MKSTLDPVQLYRQAFGTTPYIVQPKALENISQPQTETFSPAPAPLRGTVGEHGSPFYGVDVLGREYFCPVRLTLPPLPGTPTSELFDLDYPVVRIEGKVTTVDTPMVEQKGSVHEIINLDDYQIIIRGIIINHSGSEIDDARINRYYDILETGQNMKMECVITDRPLGVDKKVILKRVTMPEFFGVKNVYRYELEFVSDFIFQLNIQ